jgi:hypothetical protein
MLCGADDPKEGNAKRLRQNGAHLWQNPCWNGAVLPLGGMTVRPTIRFGSPLTLVLALTAMLWPADVQAQHRRARARLSRPVVVQGWSYRPYYYRPFFRPAYFYSPFYWGAYGWYPYYGPYGPFPPYGYYVGGHSYLSSVRVQATPREAQVYVDGYFVGLVDDFDGWSQRLRLEPGEYEIQLYLEGYRPVSEKVLLRPDSTYKLRLNMEKLGPAEATPPRPEPSASRGPRPSRRYEGRAPYERRGRRPDSRPREAVDLGTLSIRVQPPDARVEIDGERWDAPQSGERLEVQLPAGPHRVLITKEGHRSYSTEVDVRSGEVTPLNVSLPED